MISVGKISSVDAEKCTAQVTFEDRSDKVSGDLPIVVPFTFSDKAYFMPAVDERVLVAFDPQAQSKGYILGSFYADTRLPPKPGTNLSYIEFEDGVTVSYDKGSHTLSVSGSKLVVQIAAEEDVSISCKKDISIISAEGNVTLKGKDSSAVF